MIAEDLCRAYLTALNAGSRDAVRALFTSDAVVVSPLYGIWPAEAFFKDLFAATRQSQTTLTNVFASVRDKATIALQFRYRWILATGKTVEFECVDVFELTDDREHVQKLTIVYDTAPLRVDWEAARI
ncbi:MAG TPA: nuclear transport factor 2 family protein [Magnetospirillaceae bacterium]|jgi:ketosteroid isomerase-like protein